MDDFGITRAEASRQQLDDDGWEVYDPSQWDSVEDRSGPSTLLDPRWINLEDIRHWIFTCDHGHGDSCHPSTHFQDPSGGDRPRWLVDVVDLCIVPAADARYVALSYVWGNKRGTEATGRNLDDLLKPGALGENNPSVDIPRTIRHAMSLVNLLGERYLWVDRLCIVQDDLEIKHSQLALMGNIFQYAYFTIVAANGWDADHGLRGIKGVTLPRQLSSEPPNEREYIRYIDRDETIWYSRGWTFQEMFFSTRRLYFLYQYVLWECADDVWHEGTGVTGALPALTDGSASGNGAAIKAKFLAQSTHHLRSTLKLGELSHTSGPLQAYLGCVREYNSRKLTYPEDGLHAFLGVISRMTEYFPQGFLYGLPIDVFDIALLWQPYEEMTRRERGSRNGPQLPSWSWVGWQGQLVWDCWQEEYQSRDTPQEPDSSLTAAAASSNYTTLITPVAEFLYMHNDVIHQVNSVYHASWSDEPVSLTGLPDAILSVRAPVATVKLWKYGLTLGASFYLRERQGFYHWITASSETSPDSPCGVLFMQTDLHTQIADVTKCEVIALSRATAPLAHESSWPIILSRYPQSEHLRQKQRYEYYNIMWITRKDGVAYRKALGKIASNAWDLLSTQWKFINLG